MTLVRMDELLKRAAAKHIGCGAFNVGNMEMVMGAVKAAEEMKCPIILQIAERRLKHSPLELMGPMMVQAAIESSADIAVHFDHGISISNIRKALELGFTSVMFDGSGLPLAENIEKTKAISLIAAEFGACLEGELGVVGGNEGEDVMIKTEYTNPADALEYSRAAGIDALAVAIGNAHGHYICEPELKFDVLREIDEIVDVPLVLHGGSGMNAQQFQEAIQNGIRKVNIATASFQELTRNVSSYVKSNSAPTYFGLNEAMVEGVYHNVKRHIEIFNFGITVHFSMPRRWT